MNTVTSENLGSQERREVLETLGKHRNFLRYTVRDLTDEQARQPLDGANAMG